MTNRKIFNVSYKRKLSELFKKVIGNILEHIPKEVEGGKGHAEQQHSRVYFRLTSLFEGNNELIMIIFVLFHVIILVASVKIFG